MLKVSYIPHENDKFEVNDDFECCGVKISKGFKTNGANIPRVFWSIYPPNYPNRLIAVTIHDYLCEHAHSKKDYLLADKKLKEVLLYTGSNPITASLFYIGTRLYHITRYMFLRKE